MLKGLVGRPTLVDEAPEKMGEVDVEWMNESSGFVPNNYCLLLGKWSTHPNLIAVGHKDETAKCELT